MKLKRRTKEQIDQAVALSHEALDHLAASKMHPGFDYPRALLELRKKYSTRQIADFFRLAIGSGSEGSISGYISGTTPLHPMGELIYILYVETFQCKPPNVNSEF